MDIKMTYDPRKLETKKLACTPFFLFLRNPIVRYLVTLGLVHVPMGYSSVGNLELGPRRFVIVDKLPSLHHGLHRALGIGWRVCN